MPTKADVAVVRRFFAAVAAGDLAAVGECFLEDAIWHLPGTSRIAGTHRGWPAIRDNFLAKLDPLSGGTFRATVFDVAVGAEYIVSIGSGHCSTRRPPTGRHGLSADAGPGWEDSRGATPLLGLGSTRCILGDLISRSHPGTPTCGRGKGVPPGRFVDIAQEPIDVLLVA